MKRRFTGVTAVGAVVLPAFLSAQPEVKFEQYSLNNGLTVILHEDHSAPLASVMVMYHVGSKNEERGRTGFAHLFEHMMFQGSLHVRKQEHFELLQEVGANVNGTTNQDRTNYFETLPSNCLELALYLESDRMGFLLPAMTQEKLDNQRDVVKNERRQNYENVPYGLAPETIARALFPGGHPYSWPTIGSMSDLSAASLSDVNGFFTTYYAPNNACVVVAGDINPVQTKEWIARYFGPIPAGKKFERPKVQEVVLDEDRRLVLEDRVELPRLYIVWPSVRGNTHADAMRDLLTDILASGRDSRLYKSLVYEQQIAQAVFAYQNGGEIAGELGVQVTAMPGKSLTEIELAVWKVLDDLVSKGVTEKELQTTLNKKEADIVFRRSAVFGKTNLLATYFTLTGDAGNINREMQRFQSITAGEINADAVKVFAQHKVILSIVPNGKRELAALPPGPK